MPEFTDQMFRRWLYLHRLDTVCLGLDASFYEADFGRRGWSLGYFYGKGFNAAANPAINMVKIFANEAVCPSFSALPNKHAYRRA
jgi:hypothetical protein